MRDEVRGMAWVKKAGLIESCCMGGRWNISWSMLLPYVHSSSSLMGIAPLWTSNNHVYKRERYHHFVSPSTHNSWNSATDCSLFGPLKIHWRQAVHDFKNPGKVISKLNLSRMFWQAWLQSIMAENICGGLRKARVYPFNRNAISLSHSELLDKQLPASTVSALPRLPG